MAANGGRDNAFTSFDYTAYFQRVAADRLALMMEMEADRMRNLRLTENDILTERNVILEERNQRTDTEPTALFREHMNAMQYMNHPYGIPIIGWRHEMEQLGMEDVLSFYDAHYAPNNAVLVVSGDVEPEEVLALAQEHYGAIPANPDIQVRVRPQEPPQLAERRVTFRDARVAQPYVSRSYLAPERDSGAQEKAAALYLLADVLGSGPTAFLKQKLEYEDKVATFVGAYYRGTSYDDTTFNLVIVPAQGVSLEEAEGALDAALAEFMETGVDPEQLDRIKMQLRASQIYALDNVDGIANLYGRALTSGLTVADIEAWPDLLQNVTGEEIVEAARATLVPQTSVTGWLLQDEEATQ